MARPRFRHLLRRSLLGFLPDQGLGAVDAVSRVMARELGWSEKQRAAEADAYRARAEAVPV